MNKDIQQVKEEQKNFLITLIAIVAILFGFNALFGEKSDEISVPVAPIAITDSQNSVKPVENNAVYTTPTAQNQIEIANNLVKGDFNLSMAGIDALSLLTYKETTQKSSPDVHLLSPAYYTALNWTSANAIMPLNTDNWRLSGDAITPQTPVTLTFENNDVKINRIVEIDNAYMLSITDTITNLKPTTITLSQSGEIARKMATEPKKSNVHEGFVGFLQDKLVEEKYSDAADDTIQSTTTNGWFGFTDKYWQTILILDDKENTTVAFKKGANDMYYATFSTPNFQLNPNQSLTRTTRTFAGAKDINIINDYQQALHIPRFDLSIDFGWFYFLTKPFLSFLNWLYSMIGNMGVAILIFATVIRIALLPIATKSYESMAKIRKIQPKLLNLQEKFKSDKQRLQIETMQLYKREKVNPAAGCLPMLLQIPVFYALYKVLSVSINMRQAPFFGWIHDLSMPDPSSIFTLCGLIPWPVPSIINIGIWPVLMGITMVIQQKMNPAPTDPTQARIMKWLPIIFTFMLGGFASGLVIYWTWSNILSIAQQKYIMKKLGVK